MSFASVPLPLPTRGLRNAGRWAVSVIGAVALIGSATADAAPKSGKGRDVTPPQTTLTAQPPATTAQTSGSFSFSSNERASFECKLDAAAFGSCASPKSYDALAVGSHAFAVRATDPAGNVDATPATYTWQVTAPAVPPTSGVVNVPSSIPSDCSSNVQEQLASFINAQPDGSTIDFPANGCYAQSDRIMVSDKSNLTIDAHGSTFKSTAENNGCYIKGNWLLLRGTNIRMRNFKIIGNFNPPAGVERNQANAILAATSCANGNQFNMGVGIFGGKGIHVTDSTIERVYGDGVSVNVAEYINGGADPLNTPTDVHIERVKVTRTARHGYSPSSADGFWLQDSEASDSWYGGLDAELDDPAQTLKNIHILRNTFGGFFMFGIVVPVAGNANNTENIEIRDNTFRTGADNYCNAVIEVGIYPTNPNTIKNVVVANNTLLTRSSIGVRFDHVENGSISDNNDAGYVEAGCSYPAVTPFSMLTNSTNVTVANNGPGL